MEVSKMRSPKGNIVPNQFNIKFEDKRVFKSYESNIVMIQNGNVFLDETYWNHSSTTSKYRNIFLGETTNETKRKIKSGEYTLTDLSKVLEKDETGFKFFRK